MKDKVNSDADSRLQSRSNSYEDDTNSQFVVVKLEDEDPEMDLSIFAPVESSDCEEDEDELSDSSGDSSWRRNIQERGVDGLHLLFRTSLNYLHYYQY